MWRSALSGPARAHRETPASPRRAVPGLRARGRGRRAGAHRSAGAGWPRRTPWPPRPTCPCRRQTAASPRCASTRSGRVGHRLAERRFGLGILPLPLQDHAETTEPEAVGRIEPDGPRVGRDRLPEPLHPLEDAPQAPVQIGIARGQLQTLRDRPAPPRSTCGSAGAHRRDARAPASDRGCRRIASRNAAAASSCRRSVRSTMPRPS